MLSNISPARYALILAAVLAVVISLSAWGAHYPHDWMMENILVAVFVAGMAALHKRLTLSRISYTLIFLFLCLHELGAHWTYAEVPYNDWTRSLFGRSLNEMLGWQRNHFDRLVHFAYGFLLAYPIREVFLRVANVRGFWGYFLPLDAAMSTSMLFELFEWGAVLTVGGELGDAYLGTQGDTWDAHKDMALASLGALIAMVVTALINARLKRDFAREFVESLSVKDPRPLGEEAIARMQRGERQINSGR